MQIKCTHTSVQLGVRHTQHCEPHPITAQDMGPSSFNSLLLKPKVPQLDGLDPEPHTAWPHADPPRPGKPWDRGLQPAMWTFGAGWLLVVGLPVIIGFHSVPGLFA